MVDRVMMQVLGWSGWPMLVVVCVLTFLAPAAEGRFFPIRTGQSIENVERGDGRLCWDWVTEALSVVVTAAMPIAASWSKVKQQRARDGLIRPTKRPDADNYAKSLDGLNEVVFRDDAQIVELTVRKIFSDKPELRIEVTPIAGAAA